MGGGAKMRSMPIPSPVSRALRASPMSGLASARLVVLLVVVALTTGIAATVVSASTLPTCRLADTLTKQRSYADWNRTVLDTTYRLTTGYYPGDLRSTANAGLNGGHTVRAFVIADLRAMVRGRPRRRSAPRRPVGLPQLFDPEVDLRLLVARLRLQRRAQVERPRRTQRAPARDHRRLPELRRIGALVLLRLGQHQGRCLAQEERLEVRLHHVVPEGQGQRHLLCLRAVALPLRRTLGSGQGAQQRTDPAAIPLASSRPRRPRRRRRPRPRHRAISRAANRAARRAPNQARSRAARRARSRSRRRATPPRPPSRCRPSSEPRGSTVRGAAVRRQPRARRLRLPNPWGASRWRSRDSHGTNPRAG